MAVKLNYTEALGKLQEQAEDDFQSAKQELEQARERYVNAAAALRVLDGAKQRLNGGPPVRRARSLPKGKRKAMAREAKAAFNAGRKAAKAPAKKPVSKEFREKMRKITTARWKNMPKGKRKAIGAKISKAQKGVPVAERRRST